MNRNRELLGGPPVTRPVDTGTRAPWEEAEATGATEAEVLQQRRRAEVERETSGMNDAFAALQPLDYNARKRALRWLAEALEDIEVPF